MSKHRAVCFCLAALGLAMMQTDLNAQVVASNASWSSEAIQVEPFGTSSKSPVVTSARIQPGGTLIAVVGDDHIVNLFHRKTGHFKGQLNKHTDWVRTACFSPDGKKLATAGNDRQLIIWDLTGTAPRPTVIATHPAAIAAVNWSGDGAMIATVGFEDRIRVYSVASGSLVHEIKGHDLDLRTVGFSPESKLLAVGGRNGSIEIFDSATGTSTGVFPIHSQRVRSLVFTGARQIASCGDDRMVQLLDIDQPGNVRTLPGHGGKLFSICNIGDGLLATGGSDNTINLWNLSTLESAGKLTGHTGTVTSLDASNGILVSGSYDTRIRFWTTGKIAQQDNALHFQR